MKPSRFFVKGEGLELRSASSCEAKPKQKSPFFFFSGEKVVLLTKRRPFLSRLLAAASVATQKPSPTPLHVRGGDIALLAQSVASF